MTDTVECYAGSTNPETPRAFIWQGQRDEVQEVIERRREPHGVGFLVRGAQSGRFFNLFYTFRTHTWQIHPC